MRKFRLPAISRQLGFVYAANAVNGLLGLAVVPIGLRLLKADGYGLLGLYTALCAYLALCDLGIPKTTIRKLTGLACPEQRRELLRLVVTLYVCIAASLVLLAPLLAYYLPQKLLWVPAERAGQLRIMILLAVLDYLLSIPVTITQACCVAEQRFDRYSRFTVVSGTSRYTVMLLAVLWFHSPVAVAAGLAARRILDFAAARWFMTAVPWSTLGPNFSRGALSLAGSALRQSFAQVSLSAVLNAGALIANALYGLAVAGIYRATFDITTKVWFISNGMGLVLFPYFSKLLARRNQERVFSRLVKYLNASWAAYLSIAVLAGFLAPRLLPVAGLPGATNLHLFLLVLLGTCLSAHSTVAMELLQASNGSLQAGAMCVLSLGVLLAAAIYYQPRFGILSLAGAWLLSQLLNAGLADAAALAKIASRRYALWRMPMFKLAALAGALGVLLIQAGQGPGRAIGAATGLCGLLAFAASFEPRRRADAPVPCIRLWRNEPPATVRTNAQSS
jgi:O-antigen/teichoic acid export membrane protein